MISSGPSCFFVGLTKKTSVFEKTGCRCKTQNVSKNLQCIDFSNSVIGGEALKTGSLLSDWSLKGIKHKMCLKIQNA